VKTPDTWMNPQATDKETRIPIKMKPGLKEKKIMNTKDVGL